MIGDFYHRQSTKDGDRDIPATRLLWTDDKLYSVMKENSDQPALP